MTKREFERFINEKLKELPLVKQSELLDKIEGKWLPSIRSKLQNRLANNYVQCPKCKKYVQKSNFMKFWEILTKNGGHVYTAVGYSGDAVLSYECPFCHVFVEIQSN